MNCSTKCKLHTGSRLYSRLQTRRDVLFVRGYTALTSLRSHSQLPCNDIATVAYSCTVYSFDYSLLILITVVRACCMVVSRGDKQTYEIRCNKRGKIQKANTEVSCKLGKVSPFYACRTAVLRYRVNTLYVYRPDCAFFV